MRIVIDTDKERIVVPKNFFTHLDKINKILSEAGSEKRWKPEEYIKEQFEKAMTKTVLRPDDKVVK